jgi:hypothetical protein
MKTFLVRSLMVLALMLTIVSMPFKAASDYVKMSLAYNKSGAALNAETVGAPTVSGMKSSMISYAVGMGGGLLYGISRSIFGSGLIGGLLGAALCGSVVKGQRGENLATILGFMSLAGGLGSSSTASSGAQSRGTI